MSELILVNPSKVLEEKILEYKQEYLDFEETNVNGIRPTERKKGYGKQQLLLVLETAKNMKIPKVMIICDKCNIASSQTAMSCGGILTGEIFHEGKKQHMLYSA